MQGTYQKRFGRSVVSERIVQVVIRVDERLTISITMVRS